MIKLTHESALDIPTKNRLTVVIYTTDKPPRTIFDDDRLLKLINKPKQNRTKLDSLPGLNSERRALGVRAL